MERDLGKALPGLWMAGISLCLAAMVYSALSHRQDFLDGAHWFWMVLRHGRLHYDGLRLRPFDSAPQIPAVLLMKILPHEIAKTWALRALEFSYALQPALSLWAAWRILKKAGKRGYLLFPLLSFALATGIGYALVAGGISILLSLFWPLFFLIALKDYRKASTLIPIAVLITAIALTYEAGATLLLLCAAISGRRAFKERMWFDFFVSIACLLAAARMGQEILGPLCDYAVQCCQESLTMGPAGYTVFAIATSAVLLVCPLAAWAAGRSGTRLDLCLSALAAALMIGLLVGERLKPDSFTLQSTNWDRLYALPISFLIASIAWFAVEKGLEPSLDGGVWRPAVLMGPFVLASWAFYDLSLTARWREGLRIIERIVSQNKGCVVIQVDDLPLWKRLEESGQGPLFMHFQSILIHPDWSIHCITYLHARRHRFRHPCHSKNRPPGYDLWWNGSPRSWETDPGNFDYSEFLRQHKDSGPGDS